MADDSVVTENLIGPFSATVFRMRWLSVGLPWSSAVRTGHAVDVFSDGNSKNRDTDRRAAVERRRDRIERERALCRAAIVAVVQATELRNRHDVAVVRRCDRPRDGRIFAERQVRPGFQMVLDVGVQDAA